MKFIRSTMAALAVVSLLAACGGGDTDDRLDVADPKVRFVHAIPAGPDVTLYRKDVAMSDANDVGYKYASKYFDVDSGSALWSVKTTTGSVTVGQVTIDADRGDRNTIIAVAGISGERIMLIRDPYNKGLTSDKARVRVVNASFNASNVDVYLMKPADVLATKLPDFAAVGLEESSPPTDSDSVEISGGDYTIRVTTAGTKDVIFTAPVRIADNADWLLLTIPDGLSANDIKLLQVEGNDTDNGVTTEIVDSP